MRIDEYSRGFISEINKDLTIYFQHKAVFIMDLLVFSVLYIALIFMETGTSLSTTYGVGPEYSRILFFLGYIIWILCSNSINVANDSIVKDSNNGQLYAKLTGVIPIEILFFAQLISSIFMISAQFILLVAISFIFGVFDGIIISNVLMISLTVLIAMIGMYGLSLLLASFSMINKRLSKISTLLVTLLLFTSNTLTYNESLGIVFKFFPINFAIHTSRQFLVDSYINIIDYFVFIAVCFSFLIIGYTIFNKAKNKGKQNGAMFKY